MWKQRVRSIAWHGVAAASRTTKQRELRARGYRCHVSMALLAYQFEAVGNYRTTSLGLSAAK
ncbi:hypothetical protein LZ30DRAFT_392141 [Colletotrichum cereale]|nr:hypothetical protein LZ30DRAFT_392141 [Colletotrichum cereale]